MTCDDVQLAIEMSHRGAQAALSQAEIEGHVATCRACRAYEDLTKEAADMMSTTTWTTHEPIDHAALRKRVTGTAAKLQQRWWAYALGIGVVVLLEWATRRNIDPTTIAGMIGISAWTFWRTSKRHEALRVALRGTEQDLVQGLRRDLDRQIRQLRLGFVALFVLIVALTTKSTLMGSWTVGAIFDVVLYAALLIISFLAHRKVRQLRREQALLAG
jgi:hypothetical protein